MEKVTLSAKRCPARGVMVRCYGYDARNTMEKVTLSAKRCPARGVMVRCYGYDANGLTLALSTFIFFSSLLFSRLRFGVTLGQG